MALTSIRTSGDSIEIVDQLLLPHSTVWVKIDSPEDAYNAIKSMRIRGAPAIASLAALSVASYLSRASQPSRAHPASRSPSSQSHDDPPTVPQFFGSLKLLEDHLEPILERLYSSRPTAVNLGVAITRFRRVLTAALESDLSVSETVQALIAEGRAVADEDVGRNKTMARHGAEWILRQVEAKGQDLSKGVNVLTVCNTGSLATSGYGTALGIITYLHEIGKLQRAYYTQSTPYHQGSRLTALELKTLNIPSTMICDTMVGSLCQNYNIHAIVVGADRVAKNGDTANKIGTYNAAVIAARHRVLFVVAAPVSTLDLSVPDGSSIIIEHRPPIEACLVRGRIVSADGTAPLPATPAASGEIKKDLNVNASMTGGGESGDVASEKRAGAQPQAIVQITPDLDLVGGDVYNPSFDVTPAELISALVTEKGVAERPAMESSINVSAVAY